MEKIEADLHTEQVKKGRNLTKAEAETIIAEYGTIDETGTTLTTTNGEYTIALNEFIGWNDAE